MQDPRRIPPASPRSLVGGALRWLAALCAGVVVTLGIFNVVLGVRLEPMMERLLRFFPLHKVSLTREDRCALGPERVHEAVSIEGSVGFLVDQRFVALADAEVTGERLLAATDWVAVQPDGGFRLATALPRAGDAECDVGPDGEVLPTPQLVIRAPGCAERRVPVVRPWIPRRILLFCDARG